MFLNKKIPTFSAGKLECRETLYKKQPFKRSFSCTHFIKK
nr:MAG TPA: hypothetical protein [Caudoviricetes sp.]DAT49291.1 MAG TPA: hypothetical protein [Caudoviricetes sp.]